MDGVRVVLVGDEAVDLSGRVVGVTEIEGGVSITFDGFENLTVGAILDVTQDDKTRRLVVRRLVAVRTDGRLTAMRVEAVNPVASSDEIIEGVRRELRAGSECQPCDDFRPGGHSTRCLEAFDGEECGMWLDQCSRCRGYHHAGGYQCCKRIHARGCGRNHPACLAAIEARKGA